MATPPPRRAVAERFFAVSENQMHHRTCFTTKARARFDIADDFEVFSNRTSLHSTIGCRTPA